jgi:hypothetical protein
MSRPGSRSVSTRIPSSVGADADADLRQRRVAESDGQRHSHNRRVRGSRLPISGSIAVNATPPTRVRNVAIMIVNV